MSADVRKITISLPGDLVRFADEAAERRRISRSRLIAEAITGMERLEAERAAAEGYRYYAAEAAEFAEATGPAVSEAMTDGS